MSDHKKKICILAATPLTIHFFLKPHLMALAKEHDVTLMVNLNNDNYLPPLELPITIIDIPIARKIALFSDLRCLIFLIGLFHQSKYDLLITVVPKAGLLGMLAGSFSRVPRRLHIFQGEVWANLGGFMRKLLKKCDWITANLATNVLAVSASEKDFLIAEGVVIPHKINVLGAGSIGGVDLERFVPCNKKFEQVRADLGIPMDAIVMIFIGRLVADKGIHDLIQAHQLLSGDHHLWLLLVGPDEDGEIQSVKVGHNLDRIKQISYTNEPELYLSAADFLCLPSHREGFGVVIIEAASMGLPAIGSDIYGIRDAIMDRKTGLLFECGNVQALKTSIHNMIIDGNLRKTLGTNARSHVEKHFSKNTVLRNYIDYVNTLLAY